MVLENDLIHSSPEPQLLFQLDHRRRFPRARRCFDRIMSSQRNLVRSEQTGAFAGLPRLQISSGILVQPNTPGIPPWSRSNIGNQELGSALDSGELQLYL